MHVISINVHYAVNLALLEKNNNYVNNMINKKYGTNKHSRNKLRNYLKKEIKYKLHPIFIL